MRFKKQARVTDESAPLRAELLQKIEVDLAAMQYLARSGPFGAVTFEHFDTIMDRAGGALGPAKRAEMLEMSKSMLPTRTREGGAEEIRVILGDGLSEAIRTFDELLINVSPTPEIAARSQAEVVRLTDKYAPRS